MNPCKCGYYPDRTRCRCSQQEIARYLHRISRPLLDRIDIHVTAEPVSYEDIQSKKRGECSAVIRERVWKAHEIQSERYRGSVFRFNGELTADVVRKYCCTNEEGEAFMQAVYEKKRLTARTYHRLLKVARTIADLDGSEHILVKHLSEAVCYRPDEVLQ